MTAEKMGTCKSDILHAAQMFYRFGEPVTTTTTAKTKSNEAWEHDFRIPSLNTASVP